VSDAIHNGKIDSAVMTTANIDGLLAGWSWTVLEPTEGKFNWTALDAILSQAAAGGKKVSLLLGAGWQPPTWVSTDGAQKFNFVWDQASWGSEALLTFVQAFPENKLEAMLIRSASRQSTITGIAIPPSSLLWPRF
jgi:hypothetical protein